MSAKELNIGDYCYIKGISRDYGIGKITQLNSGYSSNGGELIDIQFKHSKHSVPKIEVISSPNITDILEVGDYVNGLKVIDIVENDIYISDYYAESYIGIVKVKDIKSIVTKEQFEQIVYKIK